MAAFNTWEAYFYPETYDPGIGNGTLRNLFGIRDAYVLRMAEYGVAARRQKQLALEPSLVGRTYDAEHVRAIHRYLFQDVYEWAGEYRTVNMSKNMSAFADVKTGEVDRYLSDVHDMIVDTKWDRLGHDAFAGAAATTFAYLNQAHPFREGNGRTSKVFMEHVAEQSRFTLDFSRVTPELWNTASMLSGPDLGAYAPVPDSLVPVFQRIAVPRVTVPSQDVGDSGLDRTPSRESRKGADRQETWRSLSERARATSSDADRQTTRKQSENPTTTRPVYYRNTDRGIDL